MVNPTQQAGIDKHSRLGFYVVNGQRYFNKISALIEATKTGAKVDWNFNDDVFSKIDWRIPVTKSLKQLYKERAQQLRDKYDVVSLFFSGGVDSGNALHAFIDNNIHLDEVVMYRPKCMEHLANTEDKSVGNIFSEISHAALPHLREYLKNTKTSVRLIDLDAMGEKFLSNNSLTSQWCENFSCLSPDIMTKLGMYLLDPVWNSWYSAGKKVAHIRGADKPIIRYNKEAGFTFSFSDTTAHVGAPEYSSGDSDMVLNHQFHELFYWTPDLPELVIKQCQTVKRLCQTDEVFKYLFMNSDRGKRAYYEALHHHIYPAHVNAIRALFLAEKMDWSLDSDHGRWMPHVLSKQAYGAYSDLTKYTQNSIGPEMFMGGKSIYLSDPIDLQNVNTRSIRLTRSKLYSL